jgi:DNA repair exonuclease SbcCD ATPase subunit
MRPLRFSCQNYCQHAGDHEWKFTGSVIGILGENGNGKSNLLKGIKAAVTGEFDRTKARNVTFGKGSGFIEFEFEVRPGLTATVKRDLHREKAVLTFVGEERPKVEGVRQVNAAILELLEVDKTILSEVIFVSQENLASLIFSLPTENARLAGKFFGLERAVQIEKGLSEKIAQIQMLPLPGDPNALGGELQALDKEAWLLDNHSLPEFSPDEKETLLGQIQAFNAARDAVAQRERCALQQNDLQTRLEKTIQDRDALELTLAKIPVERLRSLYVQEAEKRRLHAARQSVLGRQTSLRQELARLEEGFLIARLMTPEQLEAAEARIRELEALEAGNDFIRKEQDDLLRRTEAADGAPCPVCLKPARWTEEEIQPILDDQAKPRRNEETLRELQRLNRDARAARTQLVEFDQKKNFLNDALGRIQGEIEALGEDQGEGDPDKWDKAIRQYEELRERMGLRTSDAQRLERELAALPAPPPAPEGIPEGFHLGATQSRLEEINRAERDRLEFRHAREQLALRIAAKERERDAAARVQEQNAASARRLATLRRLRATFHPDGAPAELVGRRVARMEPRINEYLAALNVRFRARATQGFNFEYIFEGEEDFPRMAVELSGGERTATSVAFRLAALSSFGASVGLLALDEASQALDQEKIALFATMLENLKPLSKTLGICFLFVTHQTELEASFDQVIQV